MNAMKRTALLGGLLAVSPALFAQNSQVFPRDNATSEGSTYLSYIGPTLGVNRTQFILDKADIVVPNNGQITAVGFRPDNAINVAGGERILMEILMGHSDKNPSSTASGTRVESTFSLNYSDTPVTVFDLGLLTLQPFSPENPGPHSGRFMITLSRPFTYDATKNLVIEFKVRQNDQNNARITYPMDYAFNGSTTRTYGSGCHVYTGTNPGRMSSTQAQIGGNWTVYVRDALGSTSGLLFFGGTEVNIPLSPVAAPGCDLLVLPFAWVTVGTSSSGSINLNVPIPNMPDLYDLEFMAQYVFGDFFAPGGFSTTSAVATKCGRLPIMAYVERRDSYTSSTGSVRRQQGPVMFLDWQ